MSKQIVILIVCCIVLLVVYIIHEYDHIHYMFTSKHKEGLPTPWYIINKVNHILKSIPHVNNYTLIDFGCGEGNVITRFSHMVKHIHGIELDPIQANIAHVRYYNNPTVTIHSMNMMDYRFQQCPTILYMYEPLWTIKESSVYLPIYSTVLRHLSKVTYDVYIMYVTGIHRKLDVTFFTSFGFTLITESYQFRIIMMCKNYIYLFHKCHRPLT
jgi:hypothetical protein